VVNPGYVSTQEVVEKIRDKLKPSWNPVFWQSDDEFYRFGAVAPRSNCILSSEKILKTGIRLRSVNEALDEAVSNWLEKREN
jgi:hypothetical protein